jgi:predicted NBD/HSP70 family sugar kinase
MASCLSSFASVSGILQLVRAAENSIAAALKLAADGGQGDKSAVWRTLENARAAVGTARTQVQAEEVVVDGEPPSTAPPPGQLPPPQAGLLRSLREAEPENGRHPVRVERNGRDAYVTFDDDLRAAM